MTKQKIVCVVTAARIKKARQRRGLSRRQVADQLKVDVAAVAAWENGKYLPRDSRRAALARVLNIEVHTLTNEAVDETRPGISISRIHGCRMTTETLTALTEKCNKRLNALKIAYPFGTTKYQMCEFRQLVSDRILEGTLEVSRIEIFHNLKRLQEVLSNLFRFEGTSYSIKTFSSPGETVVFPGIDAYIFDDTDTVLSSYWISAATDEQPQLKISGEPFQAFIKEYWDEAWRRATSLNTRGTQNLGAMQEIAISLGLAKAEWPAFVEAAKKLNIGDGAPPLP